MIIYGSRMYGKSQVVKGFGTCDHCGRYGRQESYNGRKFGHIYFIPLIPMGGRVRVLQECASCNCGQHLPETALEETRKGVRETMDLAMAALLSGSETYESEGETVSAAATVWGGVNIMCSLGGNAYVEKAVNALVEKQIVYATPMIGAAYLRFQGRVPEAMRAYEEALQSRPDDEAAMAHAADLALVANRMDDAKRYYLRLAETAENPVPYVIALLDVFANLKDFPSLVATYGRCFQLLPQLKDDKKFVKAYKKACKKAKVEPKLP